MTDIMVDLETWGTAPGSDIRSIGAVVFDIGAGTLGEEFYINVDNPLSPTARPAYSDPTAAFADRKYMLGRDPDTIEWWSQQSEAAQQRLTTDQFDLKHGLARFADWWAEQQGGPATRDNYARFWANGSHFDYVLLDAAYRAVDLSPPWIYRAPRDCKTIWDAAGGADLPFEGTEHDALDDAKHQARCVIEAYRKLRAAVEAAKALYMAGRWSCDREPPAGESVLWENLRDACGITPGTASAAGVGS